jgi:hypothetical protein
MSYLSTVRVIGQIYEKDFAIVHIGTPVITAPAYPDETFARRVSYINPRVEPQTRTAQTRIELRNPGEILRRRMLVDVSFGGEAPGVTGERMMVNLHRHSQPGNFLWLHRRRMKRNYRIYLTRARCEEHRQPPAEAEAENSHSMTMVPASQPSAIAGRSWPKPVVCSNAWAT